MANFQIRKSLKIVKILVVFIIIGAVACLFLCGSASKIEHFAAQRESHLAIQSQSQKESSPSSNNYDDNSKLQKPVNSDVKSTDVNSSSTPEGQIDKNGYFLQQPNMKCLPLNKRYEPVAFDFGIENAFGTNGTITSQFTKAFLTYEIDTSKPGAGRFLYISNVIDYLDNSNHDLKQQWKIKLQIPDSYYQKFGFSSNSTWVQEARVYSVYPNNSFNGNVSYNESLLKIAISVVGTPNRGTEQTKPVKVAFILLTIGIQKTLLPAIENSKSKSSASVIAFPNTDSDQIITLFEFSENTLKKERAGDELIQSWIYIVTGNSKTVNSNYGAYDFGIICVVNESLAVTVKPFVKGEAQKLKFVHLSKYAAEAVSFAVVSSSKRDLWSSVPIFNFSGNDSTQQWIISEVASQTLIPANFITTKKRFSRDSVSYGNNDNCRIFFSAKSVKKSKNDSSHSIIVYVDLKRINDYIYAAKSHVNNIKQSSFSLFYDSSLKDDKQSKSINSMIHNLSPAIQLVANLQFSVSGDIFFITTIGNPDTTVSNHYLCCVFLTNGIIPDSSSSLTSISIGIIYLIRLSSDYVVSNSFMLDNKYEVQLYGYLIKHTQGADAKLKPWSNIFLITENNSLEGLALVMIPTINLFPTANSHISPGIINIQNYAVIDDLKSANSLELDKYSKQLSIISFDWIFVIAVMGPQGKQSKQNIRWKKGTRAHDHTVVLIHLKPQDKQIANAKVSFFAWQWQTAKEYSAKFKLSSAELNSIPWWKGIYYDSKQNLVMRSSVLWDPSKKGATFPTESFFDANNHNSDYRSSPFNYFKKNSYRSNSVETQIINTAGPLTMVFDNDTPNDMLDNSDIVRIGECLLTFDAGINDDSVLYFQFQKDDNPSFLKLQFHCASKILLHNVKNSNSNSNNGDNIFQYQSNQEHPVYTNIDQRHGEIDDNNYFYGDLVGFNYDMTTAGMLSNGSYNPFNDSANPVGFFYFLNADCVNINLLKIFNNNSNQQIRFLEIIPISKYQGGEFKGATEQSRMFSYYYGNYDNKGNQNKYKIWERDESGDGQGVKINSKQIMLCNNKTAQTASKSNEEPKFYSSAIQTSQGGTCGLFLLNFYNNFYSSFVSVLVQVGGISFAKHLTFHTAITNYYLAQIKKHLISTIYKSFIAVWVVFLILFLFFNFVAFGVKFVHLKSSNEKNIKLAKISEIKKKENFHKWKIQK